MYKAGQRTEIFVGWSGLADLIQEAESLAGAPVWNTATRIPNHHRWDELRCHSKEATVVPKSTYGRVVLSTRSRRLIATPAPVLVAFWAAVVALLGTAVGPSAAASAQVDEAQPVTTRESNCHETGIPRAARLDSLDALVPPGYQLFKNAAGNGVFDFIDYSCKQVFVDDEHPESMTASWIVAVLSEPSGVYILAHVTNSQELAARYNALGLPTRYEPDTTSSLKAGEPTLVHWDIAGNGVAHTIDLETSEPPETPVMTSTANSYYETPDGHQLRLTYNNSTRPPVDAVVTADFTRATNFTDVFLLPRFQTPNRVTFRQAFTEGDWTGTLQRLN